LIPWSATTRRVKNRAGPMTIRRVENRICGRTARRLCIRIRSKKFFRECR